MTDPVAWYEANAAAVSAQYEEVSARAVHGWLLDLLPSLPAAVLDVGAGSGRDAAWLAAQGYDVVAAEPSPAMRRAALFNELFADAAKLHAGAVHEQMQRAGSEPSAQRHGQRPGPAA